MLIVFAAHAGDCAEMRKLLLWIAKLGGTQAHRALLVCDASTPFDASIELHGFLTANFASSQLITNGKSVSGWPDGANSLFHTAAKWIEDNQPEPWLWMESDAIPLHPSWADKIEQHYKDNPVPFMGHIYDVDVKQTQLPPKVMSGIAVYPGNTPEFLQCLPASPRAWDVDYADVMLANGKNTNLIQHFWGKPNLAPTFVHERTERSPENTFTLANLRKEAVLFHRNKDGTLIRLLQDKLFPGERREIGKIVCVFNLSPRDIDLGIAHARWLNKLATKWDHTAIIAHDPSCPVVKLNQFNQLIQPAFERVESYTYQRPPFPQYPHAANWAWQSCAIKMHEQNNPWFWIEADAVVMRKDWLAVLQEEYERCNRSWMGSVVQHMGHMNGSAIYPADAAARMPAAMRSTVQAWDMDAKAEIAHDMHDAGHLMFHVWTLLNGDAHPVGGGEIPAGITADQLRRWLPKSAVYLHRVKDQSVINLLMKGYQH